MREKYLTNSFVLRKKDFEAIDRERKQEEEEALRAQQLQKQAEAQAAADNDAAPATEETLAHSLQE